MDEQEYQQASKPASQTTGMPEDQKTSKPEKTGETEEGGILQEAEDTYQAEAGYDTPKDTDKGQDFDVNDLRHQQQIRIPARATPKTPRDRHRAFARYLLEGKTQREAYLLAGYHGNADNPRNIWNVIRSVGVQQELARAEIARAKVASGELRDRFKAYAPEAFRRLRELAEKGKSEIVRLRALVDLLDRAGFAPVQGIAVKGTAAPLVVVRSEARVEGQSAMDPQVSHPTVGARDRVGDTLQSGDTSPHAGARVAQSTKPERDIDTQRAHTRAVSSLTLQSGDVDPATGRGNSHTTDTSETPDRDSHSVAGRPATDPQTSHTQSVQPVAGDQQAAGQPQEAGCPVAPTPPASLHTPHSSPLPTDVVNAVGQFGGQGRGGNVANRRANGLFGKENGLGKGKVPAGGR